MLRVFVDVLVPVFAVVGLGFLVARTVGAKPQTPATLAYWVLGPAFIVSVLSTAEFEAEAVLKIVGSTLLAMAFVGGVAAGAGRVFGVNRSRSAAMVLTSMHGNAGNFGLAICAFALGAEVLPIAGIVMVTINTVGIVTGVGLATARESSAWKALAAGLSSPIAVAVIPALMINLTNFEPPLWLARPIELLASALIPVMLLTLGIQLAGMKRELPSRLVSIPIVTKLIVAPVGALAAITIVGLSGVESKVVILQAAMPAAVFTSLIALEHDLEPDFVTSVVLVGTLVSAVTLPVVINLL